MMGTFLGKTHLSESFFALLQSVYVTRYDNRGLRGHFSGVFSSFLGKKRWPDPFPQLVDGQ
jgi:hypothetical protein